MKEIGKMKNTDALEMRKFIAPEFIFGKGAFKKAGTYAFNFGAEKKYSSLPIRE